MRETGENETGAKDTRGCATGVKAIGAQYSQETGGKGDMLTGEREMDSCQVTRLQDRMEWIRRYSEVEIERMG